MIVCVFDHVQWKFVRNDGLTRGYQALEGSDDEFWLAARPNGYQHTGVFADEGGGVALLRWSRSLQQSPVHPRVCRGLTPPPSCKVFGMWNLTDHLSSYAVRAPPRRRGISDCHPSERRAENK
jgi:hypothetical protein